MEPREILKESVLLYAEDEPIVMDQMLPMFKRFFKDVKTAADGEEAYEIFLQGGIQVAITDISMPKMSGLDLIKKIRDKDSKIPIVITSSYESNAYLKEAVRLYLVDYLVKPFSLDELKEVLKKSAQQLLSEGRVSCRLSEGVEYNILRQELAVRGEIQALALKEQRFLELMIHNKNRVVSKEMVEYEVWDGEEMSEAGLKNFLMRLRKKIGKDTVLTVYETGFLLNRDAE